MISLIGFSEIERGVLRTESAGKCYSVYALEILGKEICFILLLMEYLPAKVFI